MILLVDNYDSFVYNLARYVGKLGRQRQVVRNDAITINDIAANPPDAIIISPGPGTPEKAGECLAIIERFHTQIPILGICLGHQCIGEVFGGKTAQADQPVHGKKSLIRHRGTGLFMGLPSPLEAARYHSLITTLPDDSPLEVTARSSDDRILMGMQHPVFPVYGIQFHPESVLTEYGLDLIRNFVTIADQWHETKVAA